MNEIMPHWLTKQAKLSPNKIAIEISDGKTYTYLQLEQLSKEYAQKLASLNIKKGDAIAILSSNNFEMILTIHALSYLQAVVVLLNTKLTKNELHYQLEYSQAKYLILTEELRAEKELDFAEQIIFTTIEEFEPQEINLVNEINLADQFTMMFTSGTTGFPKAVVHTYRNHWASAIASVLNMGLTSDDKWLVVLPFFHVGGFSSLMKNIIYGMPIYVMEHYHVKELYHAFLHKQVTIASLVTLMLRQLLEELNDQPLPKHVRSILLGGGSVPESLLEQVEQKQIPLIQSYGMTETSSQISTLSFDDARRKLGSAGKPLFSADLKIANANEAGVGEIIVKGPMVFDGYVANELANEQAFNDGWFNTGDLGYVDDEGFLYVVDRRTDLIISGGENVYPTEIENVLLTLPEISDVAVVGKTDEKWGQVAVAFVVAKGISEAAIIAYAQSQLANFKVPKKVIFIEELPRNAANKIMRHRLQEQL